MTTVAIVLSVFVCLLTGALVHERRQNKQEVKALNGRIADQQTEIDRTRSTSTRLLEAHEEVVREGLSVDRVIEAVRKDPELLRLEAVRTVLREPGFAPIITDAVRGVEDLTDMIDVDALLSERGITHEWEKVGVRQINVPKTPNGKSYNKYALVTDLCQRCRIEHQYFRDGGHDSLQHLEGFFLGGKRLEVGDRIPNCLSHVDS